MGGFAAEDSQGGGADHVVTIVWSFALAKSCEEFVMANLIHVLGLSRNGAGAPGCFAVEIHGGAATGGNDGAIFTNDAVFYLGVAADEVALANVSSDAAGVFVVDAVVVVDI